VSGRQGGRVLDFVVIKGQKIIKVIEATSKSADKSKQLNWEAAKQQRRSGFVRDRLSGQLMKLPTSRQGLSHWSTVRRYR